MATSLAGTVSRRVSVGLSREELFVVMRLIKAASIPGFDLDWAGLGPHGPVSDDLEAKLAVAISGLMARGYLSATEDARGINVADVRMPSPVIALVGACAYGEYTLLVSTRTPHDASAVYLHELRGLAVLHDMPLPDVHGFEAVAGREGVLGIVSALVDVPAQAIALPPGEVPTRLFEAARSTAYGHNGREAASLLARGGLPAPTAEALGNALEMASTLAYIGLGRRGADGRPVEESISSVVSTYGAFLLTGGGTGQPVVRVEHGSQAKLRQWIASRLPGGSTATG